MSWTRAAVDACLTTALLMLPASLWSGMVWGSSEISLDSMGAITDPQAPLMWWRVALSPIIHQGVAHLCGNALIVWIAALVYSTRLAGDEPSRMGYFKYAELFASLYLSASVIAALRVTLSSICSITEGSIGLSGGALALVTSCCAQVICEPIPQSMTTAQALIERSLMLMIPFALLLVNQHPRADQWSHISGFILGGAFGLVLGLHARFRRPTHPEIKSSPEHQACMWRALALITSVALALAMLRALS